MPPPYTLSIHIGSLCVTHDTNVFKLGAKLGIDPMELLRMINGKQPITKPVLTGLARELGSELSYLQKLAAEMNPKA